MALRLRLRIGPFIYTEPLGRTRAQKRAAAQLRANRRWEREYQAALAEKARRGNR